MPSASGCEKLSDMNYSSVIAGRSSTNDAAKYDTDRYMVALDGYFFV